MGAKRGPKDAPDPRTERSIDPLQTEEIVTLLIVTEFTLPA